MGILERIADIEAEMRRTQKNKATEHHLGSLKAKLAKLRTQLLEGNATGSSKGEGFDVAKSGDARVAMIGFPSVGKSTLLSTMTETESTSAAYEFTTLTCIPGNIVHNGARIQLLDLPGIIEGASKGKGRGRQVIGVARTADLILMMLDCSKGEIQRDLLVAELEEVGIRLNQSPPNVLFKLKKTGGVKYAATCPLTHLNAKTVKTILQEYKIHNCDLTIREDITIDQLIDVIEGNRKYIRCVYAYNKVDTIWMEEVDRLARLPDSIVISSIWHLNLDELLDKLWEYLSLTRVYTKKRGQLPDFSEPIILRNAKTVEGVCEYIHRSVVEQFSHAVVWGASVKHNPQRVGLSHALADEDVIQIFKKQLKNSLHTLENAFDKTTHKDKPKGKGKKKKGKP